MNSTIKDSLKWIIVGGIFAIPFIPFIVSKTLLFPFITGKGFTFRILVEIIFFLWVLLACADSQYRPNWNLITKSLLVFVGVVFLADLMSKFPYKSFWSNYERMEGFVTIIHVAMYYFVLDGMFKTEIWWKRFWNTNLIVSVLISFYGILQLAKVITINQGGVRLDATFGNASYLAIYMVFGLFISLILLYKEQNNLLKWAYGATCVLQSIILYYTATRGAILGFIGGIILAAILVAWKERNQDGTSKLARKIALWLLAIVVGVVLLFISVRNTSFVQNSPVLSRFATLSVSEIETQGRYYVWPMALKGVAEKPLLGWGQESFNYVFNKFYNPAMYGQEQWFDRTHDIFLDWLINAGVIGLLSYISLYVALLYYIWKKSNFSIEEKSLLTGLVAAYIFHNIFVFDNLISYIMFMGVLAWVSANSQTKANGTVSATAPAKQFSTETINYLVAPLALILMVCSVYFVNIPAIQASGALIQGIQPQPDIKTNLTNLNKAIEYNSFGGDEILEQLVSLTLQVISSQGVANDVKQSFFTLTQDQIVKKLERTPEDARYLLLGGSFFNRVGQYDVAIPYLTDAVKYSPGKQTMYFELGSSYVGKQDFKKAFELFEQGYNLEKSNPDAQLVYAIGAMYAGKGDVVQEMFAKIGQDKVISDDRILQTFVNLKDYNNAIGILSLRLQKDPTNYTVELNLASLYATAGQKGKAIQILQDVATKNPSLKAQIDSYILQLQK